MFGVAKSWFVVPGSLRERLILGDRTADYLPGGKIKRLPFHFSPHLTFARTDSVGFVLLPP